MLGSAKKTLQRGAALVLLTLLGVASTATQNTAVSKELCQDPESADVSEVHSIRVSILHKMNKFDLGIANCAPDGVDALRCDLILTNRKGHPETYSLDNGFWRVNLIDNFGIDHRFKYAYFTNGRCERMSQKELEMADKQAIAVTFVFGGRTDRVTNAWLAFNLNLMYGQKFQLNAAVEGTVASGTPGEPAPQSGVPAAASLPPPAPAGSPGGGGQ